jgi:hypothetical protein
VKSLGWRIVPLLVSLAVLAACGSSAKVTAHTSAHSAATPHATCGQYCQQAGESAGQAVAGYPCPKPPPGKFSGCLKCPHGSCITLLSSQATVSAGMFSVRMRCELTGAPCVGALLVCKPSFFCYAHPVHGGSASGGRVAGGDFKIAPQATATVPVGLTPLGARLVAPPGGFKGSVIASVENYGMLTPGHAFIVNDPCPCLRLVPSG